jgi:hypothetical protein
MVPPLVKTLLWRGKTAKIWTATEWSLVISDRWCTSIVRISSGSVMLQSTENERCFKTGCRNNQFFSSTWFESLAVCFLTSWLGMQLITFATLHRNLLIILSQVVDKFLWFGKWNNLFLEMKEQHVSNIKSTKLILDLASVVNITQHLN